MWIGAGRGRVALHPRGETGSWGPASTHRPMAARRCHIRSSTALRSRGAMFFADLAAAVGEPERTVLAELWSTRLGGCGHERLMAAAARRGRASGARRRLRPGRAGSPAGAGRPRRFRRRAAAGRSSRACSRRRRRPRERARALAETLLDRHGVVTRAAVARRGHPRRLLGRLRRAADDGGGRPGCSAATSSRGWAARSSRSRPPSSGCATCARPTRWRRPSCSRPSIRPTRTARRSPGPRRAASWPASPAPGSSWPAEGRRSTSRRAGAASSRSSPSCSSRRSRRSPVWWSRAAPGGWRPSASTASRSSGTEAERLLLDHGFLQGHRKLVLRA